MAKDPYKYFRVEARELLEGLGRGVLELEKGTAGTEPIGRLLRLAHTLKGAARVVKQPRIAELAHAVEEALAPYRERAGAVPREPISEVLELVDQIAARVASIEALEEPGREGAARAPAEEFVESVRVEISDMDALLERIGEASATLTHVLHEMESLSRLRRQASEPAGELSAPPNTESDGQTGGAARPSEGGGAKNPLGHLERRLTQDVEQAEQKLSQVRDMANQMRLLPASEVFLSLERATRDAAESLRKSVAFETAGGDHCVDAHVLAALRNALLHVVRNAVAHGIESEAERAAAGKPAIGRIMLLVERRGNRVAFICRDDGRGLDVEAVRRAAVQRGFVASAEAESLSPEEVVRLILRGGMSTTGAVTEVSGRGIGLDVVRETAARLKGDVALRSEPGRGMIVEICVPASLSSLPVLLVEVGGMAVAAPLDAVLGTLRVTEREIARSGESDSILYEDQAVPFLSLAKALRLPASPGLNSRPRLAVVVQSGAARAAIGVDRLLGATNVLMKPLPLLAGADPLIAGALLDAEGNPRLVLDPKGLVAAAVAGSGSAPETARVPRLPVLVIDDSLTTRMLEQSILESAGYEVDLAISAEEGLDKARARRYGLFMVDVELPGMNGYEFLGRTRGDPVLRETPSIMVTSRNAPEDRRRGEELGACAYIVKCEFDQEYLLRTIRDLVG